MLRLRKYYVRLDMKCKLEEVCSYIARGITPKYSDSSNFYVMNQKCIRNNTVNFVNSRQHDYTEKKVSTDKILHLYDILVNSTGVGTAGRVAQLKSIPDNYLGITVDSHVTIVRPDPKLIYPEYLGYFLQYKQPSIESLAKGSTGQTEISRNSIVSIEIDLPDLVTQQKIVRILSELDQKIELNNQQNETLFELGRLLYVEKFENNEAINKVELKHFFPVVTGKKDANVSSEKGKYPFFTCSKAISKIDSYVFDASAILLAGNGDFNVKFYRGKFDAYQRTYVLIPNNPEYLGFLYWAISYNLPKLTANYRGSVIKFITKGNIESFKVPFVENEFILIFMKYLEKIEKNNRENETLVKIRDALLPKLISGEIKLEKPLEGK